MKILVALAAVAALGALPRAAAAQTTDMMRLCDHG